MTGCDPKRLLEALLFAAAEPVEESALEAHLGGASVAPILAELERDYTERGVRLERHGSRWAFRTAPDLAPHLRRVEQRVRPLGRAALETLAVIAYQQPVTRAEIEAVRGVAVTRGTLDLLIEAGWVKPKGRRDTPGRPVTWVTTPAFLDHFDLGSLDDLPRLEELEGADLFKPMADG
ncbi:MAG TPA: SMC-Scp complex subunit ScpB [Geminicoccaceae bacterium]|nr:SMC-Scp complex subunit ScpB [Geminicoccaceae bacterium]